MLVSNFIVSNCNQEFYLDLFIAYWLRISSVHNYYDYLAYY